MEQADIAALRVLIVGGRGHAVQTLRTVLNNAGINNVAAVEDSRRAVDMLRVESFEAVYCDEQADQIDNVNFALAARRSAGLLNPMVPIFVVYGSARRSQVEKARDIGVTDVMTRPISVKTLLRKLRVALANPRPFIAAAEFFGPDRRADSRKAFRGKDRRTRSPKKLKVNKAGVTSAADDNDAVLL
ncbi:MAG TPA: response regulator [Rhizomicrobium sp.]